MAAAILREFFGKTLDTLARFKSNYPAQQMLRAPPAGKSDLPNL